VIIAAAVVVVDQLTKTWALDHLANGPRHLLPGLKLELTYNSGIAFGLGRGVTPILVAVAVLAVVVLVGLGSSARRNPSWSGVAAMGLLLGGAAGNLADRLVRHHGGAVIDFIDFRFWWVFNLADASIVVGAIALVIMGSRRRATAAGV
jgi:signal peptidase II